MELNHVAIVSFVHGKPGRDEGILVRYLEVGKFVSNARLYNRNKVRCQSIPWVDLCY